MRSRGPISTMSRGPGWRGMARTGFGRRRHELGLLGHHFQSEPGAHRPPKVGRPCPLDPASPSVQARPLPETLGALCSGTQFWNILEPKHFPTRPFRSRDFQNQPTLKRGAFKSILQICAPKF